MTIYKSRLLLAAGAVFAASGAVHAEDIDIALIDSLTGAVAVVGTANTCGAKIAAASINDEGGVNGKNIALSVTDNQSNPAFAVQAASNLADSGVQFFVGGSTSSTVLSALPIVKDAGAVHSGGTTKAKEILESGAMVFRLNSENSQDGQVIADYLNDTVKAKRIVFASINGAYGEGAVAAVQEGLATDVTVVNSYFAPADTTNFQSVITSIVADKPDAVVVLIAGSSQPVAFIRQYKQSGFEAPLVAGAGVLPESVARAAGGMADGVVSADIWVGDIESPENSKLKADFEKYSGSISECDGKQLDKQVALTYSQVLLTALGMKQAQSEDPETVHKAILAGEWALPQGKIKFREDGQAIVNFYMTVGKDGSLSALAK